MEKGCVLNYWSCAPCWPLGHHHGTILYCTARDFTQDVVLLFYVLVLLQNPHPLFTNATNKMSPTNSIHSPNILPHGESKNNALCLLDIQTNCHPWNVGYLADLLHWYSNNHFFTWRTHTKKLKFHSHKNVHVWFMRLFESLSLGRIYAWMISKIFITSL